MTKKQTKREIDNLIIKIGKNQKQIGFIECEMELFVTGKEYDPKVAIEAAKWISEKSKCQNNIESIKKDIHILINNIEAKND